MVISRNIVKGMSLGAVGLVAIALSEGFSPVVYKDSVGIDTIGYGETQNIKKGDKITPERALAHLLLRIDSEYSKGVKNCVEVPLYQYEFDAYVDLTYNIGVDAFCHSTIIKRLREEKYLEACEAIKMWNKAGGKEVKGLTVRRERTYNMCIGK